MVHDGFSFGSSTLGGGRGGVVKVLEDICKIGFCSPMSQKCKTGEVGTEHWLYTTTSSPLASYHNLFDICHNSSRCPSCDCVENVCGSPSPTTKNWPGTRPATRFVEI